MPLSRVHAAAATNPSIEVVAYLGEQPIELQVAPAALAAAAALRRGSSNSASCASLSQQLSRAASRSAVGEGVGSPPRSPDGVEIQGLRASGSVGKLRGATAAAASSADVSDSIHETTTGSSSSSSSSSSSGCGGGGGGGAAGGEDGDATGRILGLVVPSLAGPTELRVYMLPAGSTSRTGSQMGSAHPSATCLFSSSATSSATRRSAAGGGRRRGGGSSGNGSFAFLTALDDGGDDGGDEDVDVEAEAQAEAARRDGTAERLRPGRGGAHTDAVCIGSLRVDIAPPLSRPVCPENCGVSSEHLDTCMQAGAVQEVMLTLKDDRGKMCPRGAHAPMIVLTPVPLRTDVNGR